MSIRFEVALSFAGDGKRDRIREIATILKEELGDGKVFFDEWFEAELAGFDAQIVLQKIYSKESQLVVACVCKRYGEKPWTQEEWRAILALERELRDAGTENIKRKRFLPIRFDDGEVDGLFATALAIDVRDRSARRIADLILESLRLSRGFGREALTSGVSLADPPSLPLGYLSRAKYLIALGSVYNEASQSRAPLRVLFGPSGTGKTALATDFFLQACKGFDSKETAWVDCRVTFRKPDALVRLKLVIFDNVTDNHPLISQKWLTELRSSIIVLTTASERASFRVRSDLCVADHEPSLVSIHNFDEQEVRQFLGASVSPGRFDDALACAPGLNGQPIALQLLRDVCIAGPISTHVASCSGLDGLLRRWLIEYDNAGLIAMVLEVLKELPFVGMDMRALAQVLDRPVYEIDEAVTTAVRSGLVQEARLSNLSGSSAIFVLHEAVREAYVPEESLSLPDWTQRYLTLLEERIPTGEIGPAEVLTCVDAWLIGWKEVFDTSLPLSIEQRSERHLRLLERLTTKESETWEIAVRSLPDFLMGRLQKPDQESCAVVIGLAHMIGRLKKGNGTLAVTIWNGARNPDLWARAASIAAAVSQWGKLGPVFCKQGVSELHHWLRYAKEKWEGRDSHWISPLDFDYLPAVCGLVKLENINAGVAILESAYFAERFRFTTLSHLAILVKQAETGILKVPDRKETFVRQANRWAAAIDSSPERVQDTASRLGMYLSEVFDCQITRFIRLRSPGSKTTFALDVAKQSGCQAFADFTRKSETAPSHYL